MGHRNSLCKNSDNSLMITPYNASGEHCSQKLSVDESRSSVLILSVGNVAIKKLNHHNMQMNYGSNCFFHQTPVEDLGVFYSSYKLKQPFFYFL